MDGAGAGQGVTYGGDIDLVCKQRAQEYQAKGLDRLVLARLDEVACREPEQLDRRRVELKLGRAELLDLQMSVQPNGLGVERWGLGRGLGLGGIQSNWMKQSGTQTRKSGGACGE